MNRNAEPQEHEVVVCPACRTIPLSVLSLDHPPPVVGWEAMLRERGVEVVEDDLGRPAIRRWDARALIEERREREARVAAQRAEQAAADKVAAPAGIPAREGLSAHESMMAQPGYVSLQAELGRPAPRFGRVRSLR